LPYLPSLPHTYLHSLSPCLLLPASPRPFFFAFHTHSLTLLASLCPPSLSQPQADKKLDLWSLPEVLVIHLKRFRYTRYSRDKLDTPVAFPLTGLDLGPCLLPHQQQQQAAAAAVGAGAPQATTSSSVEAQPTAGGASSPSPSSSGSPSSSMVYDCYAVSNHFGGLGGGHYTAFAQLPGAGQWYRFDDSHVGTASADEVRVRRGHGLGGWVGGWVWVWAQSVQVGTGFGGANQAWDAVLQPQCGGNPCAHLFEPTPTTHPALHVASPVPHPGPTLIPHPPHPPVVLPPLSLATSLSTTGPVIRSLRALLPPPAGGQP
jgi:hypothetical protein